MTHPSQHCTIHSPLTKQSKSGTPKRLSIPRNAIIYTICNACALILFLLPAIANAQDRCNNIGNDPEWAAGLKQLVETMQADDMVKAKEQSKALVAICPNAPTLNYLQGKIAEALGEKNDALYFYQKASENTYTFAVDPANAKKIWYARYENEYPERTADAVSSKNESYAALEAENATLKEALSHHEFFTTDPKTLMWVGTGLGAGGLAFIGAGIGMLLSSHSSDIIATQHGYEAKDSSQHAAGWVLVGMGGGLLITGAVLAGIYGYEYRQSLKDKNLSLNISPTGFQFNMKF
ncbi:MAG: hypothetical protein II180_12140 [Proteobacteria bacterium]|nr:hypothetical protein [Pseudomonadota bacterium]